MSVRTDTINLIVNVNGNQAQSNLNDLRKKAADAKFEMDGLRRGTQEYIDKAKQLASINSQMSELKKTIGITSLTQKELVAELNKLNALKGSVVPFTKEFKDLQTQIDAVKNRLYDVKNGVQGFASFFSKIKDEVKQFGALAAGYLGFQFITSQFQNIIMGAGKLSDQLADLRRVAGLTAEEANHLNSALGKIDTRTSVSSLREIAVVAGKLGVAKEDIFSFTKAVDQLVVSLGDELGNADEITTQLGKILNVFDGKITGDNISKLGNAIVDLANKGVATGGFVVDFTQRLSGLAKTSNLSLASVLGLGAGLEENGAKVESAATAISKLINTIALDIPKAAKIAGQDLNVFADSFAKRPQEALLAYAAGLQKNKSSFAEIAESFKDAGEEGARVVATLATLGNKTEFFTQKINDTGKALQNTDSITTAFALKNETFGAQLDKLGKVFNQAFTNNGVTSFLKSLVNGFTEVINVVAALPKFLNDNSGAIKLLIAGLILLNGSLITSAALSLKDGIAKLFSANASRLSAVASNIAVAAQAAYITITNLLIGRITLATAAQRLWNIAFASGTGPIGILLISVAALAALFNVLAKSINTSTTASRLNAEVQKRVADSTAEEVSKIQILKSVIDDNNVSYENKKKALQALIAINPEYLNGLTLENIKTTEGKQILDKYIQSLQQKAELEAKSSLLSDRLKQRGAAFAQIKSQPALANFSDEDLNAFVNAGSEKLKGVQLRSFLQLKIDGFDPDKFKQTAKEIKILQDDLSKAAKKNVEDVIGSAGTVVTTAASNTIAALKAQIKALDDAFENIDIRNTKALKQNRDDRKKLQDELDRLEGKQTKVTGSKNNEYDQLRKEAEKFYQDVLKLRDKAAADLLPDGEREIRETENKYDELLKKAAEYHKKLIKDDDHFNEEEKILLQARLDEILKIRKKQFAISSDNEYEDQKNADLSYFNGLRDQQARLYAEGKISKSEYEDSLTEIEYRELKQRIRTAEDYSANSKKAAGDVAKTKMDLEHQITKDLQDQLEARLKLNQKNIEAEKALRDRQAENASPGVRRDIKIRDAKDDRDAKINQLREDLKASGQAFDDESIKQQAGYKDAWDAFNKITVEATNQAKQEKIKAWDELAQRTLSIAGTFSDVLANAENKVLSREKIVNDAKLASYKKLLDGKLLSQRQYDNLVAKQDAEYAKKKHELDVKAFHRQQALGILTALINGALAVTSTLAARPGLADIFTLGAARAIEVGLVVAATAAQVAAIATQSPPEAAEGAWLRKGPKHSDPEGGIHILAERDEAIVKAKAMTDPKSYTVTGTPSQITSKLNAMHGGVNWHSGAVVEMPRFRTAMHPVINSGMPKIMEQGGIVRPINTGDKSSQANDQLAELLQKNNALLEESNAIAREKQERLHAVVSIKEFRKTEDDYNAAKRASGIN